MRASGIKKLLLTHVEILPIKDFLCWLISWVSPLFFFRRNQLVQTVWFPNRSFDNSDFRRNIFCHGLVSMRVVTIADCVDNGLPSFAHQVLAEFHPSLHGNASGRWPIVGDDQYFFRHGQPSFDLRKVVSTSSDRSKLLLLGITISA